MKKLIFPLFTLLTPVFLTSQEPAFTEKEVILETETGNLSGTITLPDDTTAKHAALIIAGSGPTDRDGNNPLAGKNNSLKMLAHGLADKGVASVRYDKRGIAASALAGLNEADLRFEHYIDDAAAWINWMREDYGFSSITVIGHSEGALIGLMAAKKSGAEKYVSLAGPSRPADSTIMEQMKSQPDTLQKETARILDSLRNGKNVSKINPFLFSLFRPSIQSYIMSWIKYDPRKEISALEIPALIVQGATDLQIKVEDARNLAKAQPEAELVIIENMNHVLKVSGLDRMENLGTYGKPDLPLVEGLVEKIYEFIK